MTEGQSLRVQVWTVMEDSINKKKDEMDEMDENESVMD